MYIVYQGFIVYLSYTNFKSCMKRKLRIFKHTENLTLKNNN